ncbi:MAG TPA: SAM-dependent methyltransferase [Candidatus Eisenbacteria bacterium]|uniref:SAM-dependent methyltransferase n=1 Tax=Eiseniibacteriota bacterium TaxID=2212470 RepID=A0A7V2AVN3_UNCEI|nr:SAM-dependent methyltransferase [Candidatus Eisenbacteria bacterium]
MAEVERFWDALAGHEYEHANEKLNRVHTQRFREAIKLLPVEEDSRVLNVWSRVGDGVPFLRRAFGEFELVNAELSLQMLKASTKLNPREMHVQTSLHELPFAGSSFDAVMSLETLEHVPDPLLFLREVRRVLTPNGVLVMSLPPSAAEWTSTVNNILKFHHGEGPHRFLAPSEVKNMIAEAGLKLLEYRGTLFLPFGGMGVERLDGFIARLIGKGPLGQLGLRQFYVCKVAR